jgi:GT2 family glycosyltransferase
VTLDLAGEHAPSLPEPASFGVSTGRRRSTPRAHVVAVVLARDGAARLPRVLAALAEATRAPDVVVGVDLGSRDDSAALLAAAQLPGAMPLLRLHRRATPADAVEAVLAARAVRSLTHGDAGTPDVGTPDGEKPTPSDVEWIWLLPHDAAPAPDALEHLLLGVENAPSVGVAGCKQVAWDDDQRLLDVGFTASPLGLRVTGLDRGEVDQGQHDGRSDVLAVSGAGMLVRRDVWEELGGLDPELDDRHGAAAADLDLCRRAHLAGHRVIVVPTAVVARATPRPPRRAARRAALHLRLAATPLALLPLAAAAVLVGGALHALALLLAGRGPAARDEAAATLAVLARPLAWRRTRRRQVRARRVPAQVLRRLRPPPDLIWRHRYDAFRTWLTPPRAGASPFRPSRCRGAALPVFLAAVAGAVLTRDILLRGAPAGVAGLLPGRATSGSLWAVATSGWRDVGLGVRAPGDPYAALVAVLGLPLGGPGRAATVLLVAGLPLAAVTAWAAASALTASRRLRTWAALGWAAAPPLLAAVTAGRTPGVGAHVLAPLAALLLARAAGFAPARRPLAAAARLGLVLVGLLACAPSLALPTVAVLAGAMIAGTVSAGTVSAGTVSAGTRRAVVPLALAAAVPAVLLLPWWVAVVRQPRLLLTDPALVGAVDAAAPGRGDLGRLVGVPLPQGLPSAGSLVVAAVVVLPVLGAAVLGVLRRRAGGRAALGWWAAGAGTAAAAAACGLAVAGTPAAPIAGLPGPGLSCALVGLGAAALLGADAAPRRAARAAHARLARALLAGAAVLAIAGPLAAGGLAAWEGTRTGSAPVPLPAVARAEATSRAGTRSLVLHVERGSAPGASSPAQGTVRWALLAGDGPSLGDASAAVAVTGLRAAPRSGRDAAVVLPVLGQVLADAGTDSRPALADLAVGSVVLLPPADPATVLALDAAPGLDRFGDARGALLWKVESPPGSDLPRPARARILDASGHAVRALPWDAAGRIDTTVASTVDSTVDSTVRAQGGGRLVVLAQHFDAGWHATLDGAELAPLRWRGWAQAFRLPDAGGRLQISSDQGRARLADPARVGVLAFALLAALPLPRVRGRADALPPPRSSRPLPRPAPAPEDLVPAPPPQVFDDDHPEDGTRPLRIGPPLRRPRRFRLRRHVRLRRLAARRSRRESP